jgi:hypothetical protein
LLYLSSTPQSQGNKTNNTIAITNNARKAPSKDKRRTCNIPGKINDLAGAQICIREKPRDDNQPDHFNTYYDYRPEKNRNKIYEIFDIGSF